MGDQELFSPDLVFFDLEASDRQELFEELADRLIEKDLIEAVGLRPFRNASATIPRASRSPASRWPFPMWTPSTSSIPTLR